MYSQISPKPLRQLVNQDICQCLDTLFDTRMHTSVYICASTTIVQAHYINHVVGIPTEQIIHQSLNGTMSYVSFPLKTTDTVT